MTTHDTALDDRLRDICRDAENRSEQIARTAVHDRVESRLMHSQVASARADADTAIEKAEAQLRERPTSIASLLFESP
jgi:hypothetical protein